jgi:glutathione S-transferase
MSNLNKKGLSMELFEIPPSGNCHKIRLFLSLLQLPYKSVPVDVANLQQKSEAFLKMNPFGQLPVLKDGETVVWDSQAILIYLARKYAAPSWLPLDAVGMSRVMEWLSTAANEVARGPSSLRVHYKFGRAIAMEDALQASASVLSILEEQLKTGDWLAAEHITIADIAIYPYIALAPEGKIDLSLYPAICQWLCRIQALPNYVDMPNMWSS